MSNAIYSHRLNQPSKLPAMRAIALTLLQILVFSLVFLATLPVAFMPALP